MSIAAGIGCTPQPLNAWLNKTEVIHRHGLCRGVEVVACAKPERVDRFDTRRLLGPVGNIPPPEACATFGAAPETKPWPRN